MAPEPAPCDGGASFAASHSAGLDRRTGSSAEHGSLSSPRSNARRHLNTWFAFTPCARATCATLAPGSSVNCTICRFSATDRHLRTRPSALTSTPCIMMRSSTQELHCARGELRTLTYELGIPRTLTYG